MDGGLVEALGAPWVRLVDVRAGRRRRRAVACCIQGPRVAALVIWDLHWRGGEASGAWSAWLACVRSCGRPWPSAARRAEIALLPRVRYARCGTRLSFTSLPIGRWTRSATGDSPAPGPRSRLWGLPSTQNGPLASTRLATIRASASLVIPGSVVRRIPQPDSAAVAQSAHSHASRVRTPLRSRISPAPACRCPFALPSSRQGKYPRRSDEARPPAQCQWHGACLSCPKCFHSQSVEGRHPAILPRLTRARQVVSPPQPLGSPVRLLYLSSWCYPPKVFSFAIIIPLLSFFSSIRLRSILFNHGLVNQSCLQACSRPWHRPRLVQNRQFSINRASLDGAFYHHHGPS